MKISAIICTYNRAQLLKKAIVSLREQTMPPEDYEIIVVDNASTDSTKEVVQGLMREVPNLRYVYESNLGLSNARNRGIWEAKGEIIAFLDDDALADKGWLAGHSTIYRNTEDIAAVGGKIQLLWSASKPKWLSAQLEGYLTTLDLGPVPRVMRYPEFPYGCNMSVRGNIAEKIRGFPANLGRKGSNLISHEEKEFFYRLSLLDMRVVYSPEAVVFHLVSPERMTKKFFLRRSYDQAISDITFQKNNLKSQARASYWFKEGAVGGIRCVRAVRRILLNALAEKPDFSFLHMVSFFYNLGYALSAVKTGISTIMSKVK